MDYDAADAAGYRDRLTALIRTRLLELPRFQQRIVVRKSRWRRTRWAPVAEAD